VHVLINNILKNHLLSGLADCVGLKWVIYLGKLMAIVVCKITCLFIKDG